MKRNLCMHFGWLLVFFHSHSHIDIALRGSNNTAYVGPCKKSGMRISNYKRNIIKQTRNIEKRNITKQET